MKQNITLDDLNQLSDNGKEKLMAWWKPESNDLCFLVEKEFKNMIYIDIIRI